MMSQDPQQGKATAFVLQLQCNKTADLSATDKHNQFFHYQKETLYRGYPMQIFEKVLPEGWCCK